MLDEIYHDNLQYWQGRLMATDDIINAYCKMPVKSRRITEQIERMRCEKRRILQQIKRIAQE
jgi:hypothetical protein